MYNLIKLVMSFFSFIFIRLTHEHTIRKLKQCGFVMLTILALNVNAQTDTIQYFSKDVYPMSSLCSKSLVLDSEGTFFQERGCEGGSIVSYGKYTVTGKGLLHFSYLPLNSIKMIKNIEIKEGKGFQVTDTTLLISWEGDTLKSVLIDFSNLIDSSTNCMNQWFIKIGNRSDTAGIEYNKVKKIYEKYYQKVFPSFYNGSLIIIRLNIPRVFLSYSGWQTEEPEDFQLVRRPFGLYSTDGRHRIYTLSR